MPASRLIVLILSVIVAAGATVWLLTLGGPSILVAALPAFMIAVVALRIWRR